MEVDHSLAKLFLIFCLIISVREQAYSAKSEARRGSTTIASSRRNRTALTMQNCVTKALEVAIDLDDEEKVALCGIFVPLYTSTLWSFVAFSSLPFHKSFLFEYFSYFFMFIRTPVSVRRTSVLAH